MLQRNLLHSEIEQVLFRIYQAAGDAGHVIPERVMGTIKENLKSVEISTEL